jgi:hypothetical protein
MSLNTPLVKQAFNTTEVFGSIKPNKSTIPDAQKQNEVAIKRWRRDQRNIPNSKKR